MASADKPFPQIATVEEQLRAEIERLRRQAVCDICCGVPLPEGLTCACGGTGNVLNALDYTRRALAITQNEVERLRKQNSALRVDVERKQKYIDGCRQLIGTQGDMETGIENLIQTSIECQRLAEARDAEYREWRAMLAMELESLRLSSDSRAKELSMWVEAKIAEELERLIQGDLAIEVRETGFYTSTMIPKDRIRKRIAELRRRKEEPK